jgi:nitrogen fixation NifU-like protein
LPSYTDVTLDHFFNPRNARKLDDADAVGKAGNPEKGGPFMLLYLKFEGEKISAVGFQTYGCCAAIAAGSALTELVKGKSTTFAAAVDEKAIDDALGGLPLEKRHCSTLAARALEDALAQVQEQKR